MHCDLKQTCQKSPWILANWGCVSDEEMLGQQIIPTNNSKLKLWKTIKLIKKIISLKVSGWKCTWHLHAYIKHSNLSLMTLENWMRGHLISDFKHLTLCPWVSQLELVVKNWPANEGDTRDVSSIPGWIRSPGGGHGNVLGKIHGNIPL